MTIAVQSERTYVKKFHMLTWCNEDRASNRKAKVSEINRIFLSLDISCNFVGHTADPRRHKLLGEASSRL